MKRKHMKKLLDWKNKYLDKPYILMGARQTGKTYLLKEFCKQNFDDYIYINLDENSLVQNVFEETIKPDEIITRLSAILGRVINPDETVLFFDEIQISERAITSLKYFSESEQPYKIVCAGSLLGVALNRFRGSYPVGKVVHGYLYPMDFEEFMWANSRDDICEIIKECFSENKQMSRAIHSLIMKYYRDFLYVGGMPASILEYLSCENDITKFDRTVKSNIINAYIFDMSKYTTSAENIKINKLYNSIPRQLNKENTKFTYNIVEEGGSKREFETSIDWLINAELVMECKLVEHPKIPLKAHEKDTLYKIYMNDVGLLCELSGIGAVDILTDSFNRYAGMLAENYIAQTLKSNEYNLYYWKSKRNAELDFLIHKEGKVIPVQVKSATNTKAQSLKVYTERYNPEYSLKISGKNFGYINKIKSIPLYAAYLI